MKTSEITSEIKRNIEMLKLLQKDIEKEDYASAEDITVDIYKNIEYLLDEIQDARREKEDD